MTAKVMILILETTTTMKKTGQRRTKWMSWKTALTTVDLLLIYLCNDLLTGFVEIISSLTVFTCVLTYWL